MNYTYSFCVWPDETKNFGHAIFLLFKHMTTRVEMEFESELAFNNFRHYINLRGLTLREIERWPTPTIENIV